MQLDGTCLPPLPAPSASEFSVAPAAFSCNIAGLFPFPLLPLLLWIIEVDVVVMSTCAPQLIV